MKALPLLLLNVAMVASGIVVYDQVVRRPDAPARAVESPRVDVDALEQRLEALETDREPALRGPDLNPLIFERLDTLEEALRAETAVAPPAAKASGEAAPGSYDPGAVEAMQPDPAPEEVARWRRVRDAVQRQDKIDRNRERLNRALNKLSINLTPRQRDKIHVAYAAFEPRVREIWTEAKSAAQATIAEGGQVDRATVVSETTSLVQQEFAETLTGIVHHADAEAVAEAMLAKGR